MEFRPRCFVCYGEISALALPPRGFISPVGGRGGSPVGSLVWKGNHFTDSNLTGLYGRGGGRGPVGCGLRPLRDPAEPGAAGSRDVPSSSSWRPAPTSDLISAPSSPGSPRITPPLQRLSPPGSGPPMPFTACSTKVRGSSPRRPPSCTGSFRMHRIWPPGRWTTRWPVNGSSSSRTTGWMNSGGRSGTRLPRGSWGSRPRYRRQSRTPSPVTNGRLSMSIPATGPTRPTSCGSGERLREMGVIERIGYKRNIETFRGEYSEKGKKVTYYSA